MRRLVVIGLVVFMVAGVFFVTESYADEVDDLIEALGDSDSGVRWRAVEALGEIGDSRAVEPLIEVLVDSDTWMLGTIQRAAEALGKIGDSRAVEPLVEILARGTYCPATIQSVAFALGEIGDSRAVDVLIKEVSRPLISRPRRGTFEHSNAKIKVVEALVKIGGEKALNALKQVIKEDLDNTPRNAVHEAIAKIERQGVGDSRAVEPLIEALGDSDSGVRWRAVEALGEIGDSRAVEPLIKALGDSKYWVRWRAVEALGEIGDPRAVEPLIKVLGDSDNSDRVLINAAEALGKIGEPAVEPLIKVLGDSDNSDRVLINAAEVLGKIGDPRAIEPLIEALGDSDRRVCMLSAYVLGEIGDPRAVEPLIKALGDSDSGIRWRAAIALGEIGDSRAVEPLIEALGDSDRHVRRYAARALGKIGEPAVELLQEFIRKDEGSKEAIDLAREVLQILGADIPETIAEEPTVDELIRQLSSDDKEEIIKTAEKLEEEKAVEAVEPLMKLLGDIDQDIRKVSESVLNSILSEVEDEELRRVLNLTLTFIDEEIDIERRVEASKDLAELADVRAVPALARALADTDILIARAAEDALIDIGKPAQEVLEKYIGDEKISTLVELTMLRIERKTAREKEEKINELLTVVLDEDVSRSEKILAIDELGDTESSIPVDSLLVILGEQDKAIRGVSRSALSRLQSYIEEEQLYNVVDNVLKLTDTDLSAQQRIEAADNLGRIGDVRAVDAMARVLADDDFDIVMANIKALVDIGTDAVGVLEKYIDDIDIGDDIRFVLNRINTGTSTGSIMDTASHAIFSPASDDTQVNQVSEPVGISADFGLKLLW